MAKVTWTFQALEDVATIAEYHEEYSERYGAHLVKTFFAKVNLLESFPLMGRIVPETNLASIRELIVTEYRIIYAISHKDEINILAVRHSSRPLTNFSIQ